MQFINSYRWLIPSVAFSLLLLAGRIIYTCDLSFIFLAWNLFLAVIPLFVSHKIETANGNRKWLYAMIWLPFFPNAMYIVTDLFHLRERGDIPLWYDLLLLLSTALNGLIMGFISLYKIEAWLAQFVKRQYLSIITFLLLLLCGYGIYLGRYERWNSWDIVAQPISLFVDVKHHVVHPFRNLDIWLLSTCFGLWMYLIYKYVPYCMQRYTHDKQQK